MIILIIIFLILGIAFTLFGYYIYYRKKFNLINGYERDSKDGKKSEKYAKAVGLTEFVIGIVWLIVGIILIVFL